MSTPALDKIREANERGSQAVAEFIDWLGEQGLHIAEPHTHSNTAETPEEGKCWAPHRHDDNCPWGRSCKLKADLVCGMLSYEKNGVLYTTSRGKDKLLNTFFGIDEDAVERERRAILDNLQADGR